MTAGLEAKLARLPDMTLAALRAEWRRVYRASPPDLTADLLMRGIAWELQAKMLGGLSRSAQRQLQRRSQQLQGMIRPDPRQLKPGMRLVRRWQGRTHDVLVTADGFLWNDQRYRSLSQIAEAITGTRWSGPRFFGLQQGSKAKDGNNG
jgi:Protein of unknown function (DUF2924)